MKDIEVVAKCIEEMGYYVECVANQILVDGQLTCEPMILYMRKHILFIEHGRCGNDKPLGNIGGLTFYGESQPRFNLADPESFRKINAVLKICTANSYRRGAAPISLCTECGAAHHNRHR